MGDAVAKEAYLIGILALAFLVAVAVASAVVPLTPEPWRTLSENVLSYFQSTIMLMLAIPDSSNSNNNRLNYHHKKRRKLRDLV